MTRPLRRALRRLARLLRAGGLVATAALALAVARPAHADDCADPHARPGRCPVPPSWTCLSPALAGAERAAREADAARCEARIRAAIAEGEAAARTAEAVGQATADGLRGQLAAQVDLVEEIERRALESEGRWTTWEVVGWAAGGTAVGAAVGVLAYWLSGL